MQNHIQKNYRKNNSTLNILFEDSDIIVCEKPHGTATQSRRIGSPDMVNLIKRHIYETSSDKSEPYLAVIHRLDQPVRGILVFAKTPAAAKDLNRQIQNGDFGKYYLALTNGIPSDTSGTLENYLYKNPQTNTASVCDAKKKGAKKARLFYEIHNELRDFFTDTSRSTPDTINTNSEDIFFSKNPVNTEDEHASDIQDIFSSSTSVDNGQSTKTLLKSIWTPDAFIRSAASSLLSDARSSATQNTIQTAVQKKDGRHYVCVHINLILHILSHIKKGFSFTSLILMINPI